MNQKVRFYDSIFLEYFILLKYRSLLNQLTLENYPILHFHVYKKIYGVLKSKEDPLDLEVIIAPIFTHQKWIDFRIFQKIRNGKLKDTNFHRRRKDLEWR